MDKEISFGILPLRKREKGWELFLVQHKNGNFWGFPKGHADKGESPFQTAARELKEETDLDIEKFLTLKPYSENYSFMRDGRRIKKEVHYYSALVEGEGKRCQEELLDAGWFPIDEVEKKLTYLEAKKIFTRLKEDLK
ncbi:MAG: NUDIX domain-containing protein [Candidatus Algichlamydia australiensis]|nr:NUDIX domain-containing protein [Chlamydiales bacterium]